MKTLNIADLIFQLSPSQIENLVCECNIQSTRSISSATDLLDEITSSKWVLNMVSRLDLGTKNLLGLLYLTPEDLNVNGIVSIYKDTVTKEEVENALSKLTAIGLCWIEKGEIFIAEELKLSYQFAGLGRTLSEIARTTPNHYIELILRNWGVKPTKKNNSYLVNQLKEVFSSPQRVERELDSAPEGTREIIEHLKVNPQIVAPNYSMSYIDPKYRNNNTVKSPVLWLAERGLVWIDGTYYSSMPFEAGVAVRGGKIYESLELRRPDVETLPINQKQIDQAAMGSFFETLDTIENIYEIVSREPVEMLKSGGLGVKATKKLAKQLNNTPEEASFFLELLHITRLIGMIHYADGSSIATFTENFEKFINFSAEEQWSYLTREYLASPQVASCAITAKKFNIKYTPLTDFYSKGFLTYLKLGIISSLPDTTSGHKVSAKGIKVLINYDFHMLCDSTRVDDVGSLDDVLYDMEKLGLIHDGAIPSFAKPLAYLDNHLATSMFSKVLPPTTSSFLIQADFSVVVDGIADKDLRRFLEKVAKKESKSAATIYRLSKESITNAFENGETDVTILEFLTSHSRFDLPQALVYLIKDLSRKFGQVTITPATTVITIEDSAVLRELLNTKQSASLDFRQISPEILISPKSPKLVYETIKSVGFIPKYLNSEGQVDSISSKNTKYADPSFNYFRPGYLNFLNLTKPEIKAKAILISDQLKEMQKELRKVNTRPFNSQDNVRNTKNVLDSKKSPNSTITSSSNSNFEHLYKPDEETRPVKIANNALEFEHFMSLACLNEWLIRVSYISGKAHRTVYASVDEFGSGSYEIEILPTFEPQHLNQRDIVWLRVLTEEEEEAILFD